MDDKTEFLLKCEELNKNYKLLEDELRIKTHQFNNYIAQLTAVSEKENHYIQEINALQDQEEKQVNQARNKIKSLQETSTLLKQEYGSNLALVNEELGILEKEIENHSEIITSCNNSSSTSVNESFDRDFIDLESLNCELFEKENHLARLKNENNNLNKNINNLVLELERTTEDINCKDETVKDMYKVQNAIQEELTVKKNELKSLTNKRKTDVTEDDSIFSEVNDRRLELQETLLAEQKKCIALKEGISCKQKQMSTLRFYNEDLKNLLKNEPREIEQDYQMLFEIFKNYVSTLNLILKEYEKDVAEKQKQSAEGLPKDVLKFLDEVDEKYGKSNGNVQNQIGMEFTAYKLMMFNLNENNIQIKELRTSIEDLNHKILEFENNINEKRLCKSTVKSEMNSQTAMETKTIENAILQDEKCKPILRNCDKEKMVLNHDNEVQNNKSKDKRVMFSEDTVDSGKRRPLRRGGKVIKIQTIVIPDIAKK